MQNSIHVRISKYVIKFKAVVSKTLNKVKVLVTSNTIFKCVVNAQMPSNSSKLVARTQTNQMVMLNSTVQNQNCKNDLK
jgi:hypothetical protein